MDTFIFKLTFNKIDNNSYSITYEGNTNNETIFKIKKLKLNDYHKDNAIGIISKEIYNKLNQLNLKSLNCDFLWPYDFSQPDFLLLRIQNYLNDNFEKINKLEIDLKNTII